jgi:cytoskeletal protein RodZ
MGGIKPFLKSRCLNNKQRLFEGSGHFNYSPLLRRKSVSRLEGRKSNTNIWIIAIILLLAVAAALYFLFARPAGEAPADNAGEPTPTANESNANDVSENDVTQNKVPATDEAQPQNAPENDSNATSGEVTPDAGNATGTPAETPLETPSETPLSDAAPGDAPSGESTPEGVATPPSDNPPTEKL